jgi:hypothetical protein
VLVGADPLTVPADLVAGWIGDLHQRPNQRSTTPGHGDSSEGLAKATIQQRVVAVRSFYEFLVEDGLRERTPCGVASPGAGQSRGWCGGLSRRRRFRHPR